MAIFKPVSTTSSNSNKFLGICEIAIIGFKDKSAEFDWADLYLDVTVKPKDSDYTRNIQIKGSFERDSNNKITGGSVFKRLYMFFDTIGCKAGLNIDGTWEDEDGKTIENIVEYLEDNFLSCVIPGTDPVFDYLAYIYKEKPKKVGDRAWTRVYHKVYKNTEGNLPKLKDDIKWLKDKGVIKELDDIIVNNDKTLTEGALSNL
jgi:hypothetical protein